MKDNKFVPGIKTAGVVATVAFTMASCGNKLSESEIQTVQHKTDSASSVHQEYRMASNLFDICDLRIQRYRDANKDMVKRYAKNYIANNIKDMAVQKFMLESMDDEYLLVASNSNYETSDSIPSGRLYAIRHIRREYRWFNDMLLYLTDKYDEQQLLKSGFFEVINSVRLKKTFEKNTNIIEEMKSSADFASERKNIIREQLWKKYTDEVKRQR